MDTQLAQKSIFQKYMDGHDHSALMLAALEGDSRNESIGTV
jgi:hypothetical protein